MSPFFCHADRKKDLLPACLPFIKLPSPVFWQALPKRDLGGEKEEGFFFFACPWSIAEEKQMTVLLKAFFPPCHNPLELTPAVPQGVGAMCTNVCLLKTGGKRVSINV